MEPEYTVEELENWIIGNADQKGSADFNLMVEEYDRLLAQGQSNITPPPEADPTQELGFLAGIGESITGNLRETPEVLTLPKAGQMPELNLFRTTSVPRAFLATLGTAMGDTEEMAKVIRTQFPNVELRFDNKNNPILRSAIDNKEYVIAPGFDLGDIFRAGETAAIYGLTKGKGYLGTALQAGATQTTYEAGQTALGGEFDTGEIVGATFFSPIMLGLSNLAKSGYNRFVTRFLNKEAPPAPTAPAMSDEEIVELAVSAARGNATAQATLAELGLPDEATLAAAKRLGIEEFLQPDHLASNQVYIEIAQAAKSEAASAVGAAEKEGLEKVAKRAVDLVDELGGVSDLSMVNRNVYKKITGMIDELQVSENKLWESLREKIGNPRTNPERTLRYLESRIAEVGGDVDQLLPLEKKVWEALKPKEVTGKVGGDRIILEEVGPTYVLLDQWRREVGLATKGRGAYADTQQGLAKKLYGLMRNDVQDVAEEAGAGNLLQQTLDTSRILMGLENDSMSLFGKQLQRSLVPEINGAVQAMSRGDATRFIQLMEAIPPEMRREVTLSSMMSAFTKGVKNEAFNFNDYAKWYGGLLRNREAKVVLDRALGPEARQMFNSLYVVSKGVNRSLQQKIRTGRPRAVLDAMNNSDKFIAKLFEASKRSAVGLPIEAGFSLVGLPMGYGMAGAISSAVTATGARKETVKMLGEVISSPSFLNMIDQAGTAQEAEAARRLANSTPFKQFMRDVNLPADDAVNFIISTFQAPRAGIQGSEASEIEAPEPTPTPPPQARVQPPAPPTRGIPGMGGATPGAAPAPSPTAQGPQVASQSSREMLKSLFPMDTLLG
jgi:hypothetical protein